MNNREEIKKRALEKGVSFYRLAKVAGMQQTQLKKYLNGEQDTKSENVERMILHLREL